MSSGRDEQNFSGNGDEWVMNENFWVMSFGRDEQNFSGDGDEYVLNSTYHPLIRFRTLDRTNIYLLYIPW